MPSTSIVRLLLVVIGGVSIVASGDLRLKAKSADAPFAWLAPAPPLSFASDTDSSSPAVWSLVGGRQYLYLFNSSAGQATQSRGLALDRLAPLAKIKWAPAAPFGGSWLESIVADTASSYWYGYYHNEREDIVCPGTGKSIPAIGAARSSDRGATWRDLGFVLEAPPGTERCDTTNQYFVGGIGDFSAVLDRDSQFLYFFYTQYFERGAAVGVSVARMNWADRNSPTKRAQVWNGAAWIPGGNQRVLQPDGRSVTEFVHRSAAPLMKALDSWDGGTTQVDVFWGPSIHWNTSLNSYVMLLNRARNSTWDQEGVYISFNASLDQPRNWTEPELLLHGGRWYPQVIGTGPDGTDKTAGASARFFMSGRSDHLIHFSR